MKSGGQVAVAPSVVASSDVKPAHRASDFVTLTKPRLNFLVLMTTLGGMYLAAPAGVPPAILIHGLFGTALVAGGAAALNQVWERETDGLMRRTRTRPIPDGRLRVADGTVFGVLLSSIGLIELAWKVNPISATVAAATLVSYVLVYTPLKKRTSLATLIGAVPGALPPVIGWAAATGTIALPAFVLFGIVFLWQMPHFLAIAWLYREDYSRAGIPLLPVLEPDGRRTGQQALLYAAALWPVSLLPALVGIAGAPYSVAATVLGVGLIALSALFARERTTKTARRLFLYSIAYLPLLWGALVIDRVWQPPLTVIQIADLPALNATLNATSAIFLTAGYAFIRSGRIAPHRRCMLAALGASTLFLISYVVYHVNTGSRPFPGSGPVRYVYFSILITHVLLAATILPLALITATRGLRAQYDRHVRIARWTLPLWMYVSVTGVVIYLMLYRLY